MGPPSDDEATAQIDIEALRRRGASEAVSEDTGAPNSDAPPSPTHIGRAAPLGEAQLLESGEGPRAPESMSPVTRAAGPEAYPFPDEEHTAADLRPLPRPRAVPPPPPAGIRSTAVTAKVDAPLLSAAALWSRSALLDEPVQEGDTGDDVVLSSAPLTEFARTEAPPRGPEDAESHGPASWRSAAEPWVDGSDEWLAERREARPASPASPASLEEPTLPPKLAPTWGGGADGEPNTIVPHMLPRDRDGRIDFEPTLAIEELGADELLDVSGELVEATLIARPNAVMAAEHDIPLGTGDFELFEPDSADVEFLSQGFAASQVSQAPQAEPPEASKHAPVISSKQNFGYAEDLATDPQRSLRSLLRGPAPSSGGVSTERLEARPLPSFSDATDADLELSGATFVRVAPLGPARSGAPDEPVAIDSDVDIQRQAAAARRPDSSAWPAHVDDAPLSEPTHARADPAAASVPVVEEWELGEDSEERALREAGLWDDLCDLLLARVDRAHGSEPRARLLARLASALEVGLADRAQALDALVDAYRVAPEEPSVLLALERAAPRLGGWEALARVCGQELERAEGPARVALLADLVRWLDGPLGRPADAEPYAEELQRLAASHPVALRRRALAARAEGDLASFSELAERALQRAAAPHLERERIALHLALADAQPLHADASVHVEAALELDPTNPAVLLAFERIAARFDQHEDVRWALEQLIAHGQEDQRVDAYLRLADLLEARLLKRDEAVTTLLALLARAPGHAGARHALERCYLALRDWPRLVEAVCARAAAPEVAADDAARAEALAYAAELSETRLGDQVGAAEQLARATRLAPTSEATLAQAAMLAERMQELPVARAYRVRLAELAREPAKKAEQYLAVALACDDPLEARSFFEQATQADPSSVGAWEGIERVAREVGDERGALLALRGRIDATESQRTKGQLLLQLGARLGALGEADDADRAYEAALKADPSNEGAAVAVLSSLVAAGRFAEAEPACELLVTAAARDRDPAALFARLLTKAKIAIGIGDLSKALAATLAAVDTLPTELEPVERLADVLVREGAPEPADDAHAAAAFSRVAARAPELDVDVVAALARRLASRGDHARVVELADRALLIDADDADDAGDVATGQRPLPQVGAGLFAAAAESLAALGDLQRAAEMRLRSARATSDPDARYAALVATVELYAHELRDLASTKAVAAEALALRADDDWLLKTSYWAYGADHDWEGLVAVLEGVAHGRDTPDGRARTFMAAAEVALGQLGDRARASELYEAALDADSSRDDVFHALVGVLGELGEPAALEAAYRRMCERADASGDVELRASLDRELARMHSEPPAPSEHARDHDHDHDHDHDADDHAHDADDHAHDAEDEPGRPAPADLAAVEDLVAHDELDRAYEVLRQELRRDPHDARCYEVLYGVYLRQRRFDRALATAQVLAEFRVPSAEEQQFIDDYPPCGLGDVPGSLLEEAWTSHLFPDDLDPMLTSVFAWMTPAMCRLLEAQMSDDERVRAFGTPLSRTHSRSADVIRTMFHDGAEILALADPELLVGSTRDGAPFASSVTPFGAITVDVDGLVGREALLPYFVGAALAEQRPELAPAALFRAPVDLTRLLATAVRVAMGERGSDGGSTKQDRLLVSLMSPDERESVTRAVEIARAEGVRLDVPRWSRAAEQAAMRVGLLLSQDVAAASRAIEAEPPSRTGAPARDKLGALYLFATGELYADLRQAVGVSVADGEG